ncbi:MAG: hypothetical protein BKP49_09095 [Treponema sp. CETP13]|nr:MAG: hypothetical protein BKP49_09095 [Treponema sp. CETP13]
MNVSSYISLEKSKTGIDVPIFTNGTPSCSLYNPEREADLFANLPEFSNGYYFVIGGYASGLHIKKLREKYKNAYICILEDTLATIQFCKENNLLDFITKDQRSVICNIASLEKTLIETYFPPIHGNFIFKALRSWEQFHIDKSVDIKIKIEGALKKISADISVQAHFGKLWHRNILLNLKLSSLSDFKSLNFDKTIFPTHKKAVVCGAGPGLDYSFKELLTNRDNYYIVATDTSYPVLLQKHIISDAVVTTDAQNVSIYHFITGISKRTLFVSDLSASPSIARIAYKQQCTILFYDGGHPLSKFANNYNLSNNDLHRRFPFFSAGAGSVTLVCLDFIFKSGFTNYGVIGADFSYINDKTYTNGTYLDILFLKQSYKLNSLEHQYNKLMFRTPLKKESVIVKTLLGTKKSNGKTTETLMNYRMSLDTIILKNNNKLKHIDNDHSTEFIPFLTALPFNFTLFKISLYNVLNNINLNNTFDIDSILYPYMAYYAKYNNTIDFRQKITDIINKTKLLCEEN